jgi:hypothetical protein
MTTRIEHRANLAALSDADLQAQCLTAIRRYKRYSRSDKDATLLIDDAFGECLRREKRDLWDAAIEAWKAERKEKQAEEERAKVKLYAEFDAQQKGGAA